MRKKKVLIIGATGFIGKHLVKELIKDKENQITCLIRESSDNENVKHLSNPNVKFFKGDLTKKESLQGIDKNIDFVFYLAGGGNVSALSSKDLEDLETYNLTTLENFLQSIKKIKKIIFFSSISAIGIHPGKIIDENVICTPTIPHEKCKLNAEKLILKYSQIKKYDFSILRPSIVYGEYCFGDSYKLVEMLKKNYSLFPGNGKNFTPWVYVGNVVNAAILLLFRGKGEPYIINNEEKVSFNKIINLVQSVLHKKTNIIRVPLFILKPSVAFLEKIFLFFGQTPPINSYRLKSMSTDRIYSINKIKKRGYKEEFSFESSFMKTLGWYKKNGYI